MTVNQDLSTKAGDILVIDDTIASLRMLTEILRKAGYKSRPVEDPQLALKAALTQPPDLILLDIRMPKMSGFELSRRLKQDERTRDVPIIFVSALEDIEDRLQGFEVGGVDFIPKPIQEAEVLARVKTHLHLRYTQLHLEELVAERTAELEKLSEERLKALTNAEAQIRTLFEKSPAGIALSSLEGEFLVVNQSLIEMLRITEKELLQRNVTDFYAVPGDRDTLLNKLQESGSVRDFGVQLVRHDGSPFFANLNVSQLVLEGNDVLLAVVEDVSHQIMANQEMAALEERERLARDLHDSVTQTLFSASVTAQALPRMLDKNPAIARQNAEQLAQLIRGTLAEMRVLLLELRPRRFEEKSLAQVFDWLAESTRARTQARVTTNVEATGSLPNDVSIAIYRIAQESLNNTAKHAMASEIVVNLSCDPKGAVLCIQDDGHGFDPDVIPGGHFGLSIMRERAQKIGAAIQIDSEIGRGTQVYVVWPDPKSEDNRD